MTTYLPPVEKPHGLVLKLAFAFMRRQFGKVMTPLTVFGARMPLAFTAYFGKVSRLDKKLQVPARARTLVRAQVASVNMCLFCMDAARWAAMRQAPEDAASIDALDEYRTSPLFSEAERAALDYATELTSEKHVSPATFAALARHYSEREICDIVWLVASEHLYNISNIGLNIGSDGFCELAARPARSSGAAGRRR